MPLQTGQVSKLRLCRNAQQARHENSRDIRMFLEESELWILSRIRNRFENVYVLFLLLSRHVFPWICTVSDLPSARQDEVACTKTSPIVFVLGSKGFAAWNKRAIVDFSCTLKDTKGWRIIDLKGHSQLWNYADPDTCFLTLKKVHLNLKSKYI